MKKKVLRSIGSLFLLLILFSFNSAFAQQKKAQTEEEKIAQREKETLLWEEAQREAAKVKKVLLVYQQKIPDGAKYDAVHALRNQISHFNTRIVPIKSSKYEPGMLQFYDVVFYVGFNDKEPPPKIFYEDVIDAEQTICWLYANAGPVVNREGDTLGFRVSEKTEFGFNSLSYEGISFSRSGDDAYVITITDRKKAKPRASYFRRNEYVPYAVQSDNFWYVSDLPFFLDSSGHIFCDLLHEVFKEPHSSYKYAMIRIEDVHPYRDPKQLRKVGDIFKKYKIPFSFAIIPVYTDPETKERATLAEKPYLIAAMQYLQEVGGTPILHGYTHQYRSESGEGHEFWDINNDTPIAEDSEKWIRDKLNKGVDLCADNGIFPLAWETPHYGASELDYKIFSEIFSTGVERMQLSDLTSQASQSYPYFIQSRNGRWIVPENLGYVSYREGQTVDKILEEAYKILVVRDAVAVGFFHPYVETEHLEKMIIGLKDLGYFFLDMKTLPNQVKTDKWQIYSGLPYFYGETENKKVFYNREITPIINLDIENKYIYSFVMSKKFKKKDIDVSEDPVNGDILTRIPRYQEGVFVIRIGDEPKVGLKSFEHWALRTFLGTDSRGVADSMMRLLMWGLFIITALLLVFLLVIFISFAFTKRKGNRV